MSLKGKRVTLHRSADQGTAYGVAIARMIAVDPPEVTADVVEDTEHGGTDDFKTFAQGLLDGGEFGGTFRYSEATQAEIDAMEDSIYNGTMEYLQLQFPAPVSKSLTFKCVMTTVGHPSPRDGLVDRTLKGKVSGKPVKANLP